MSDSLRQPPVKGKPPAFQLYARDWLVDTINLTLEQQGAYMRLLAHQWIEGPLDGNDTELARRLAIPLARFRILWARLREFFPPRAEDGRLANPRLERVRGEREAFHGERSSSGRKGAAARWNADRASEEPSSTTDRPLAQPIAQPTAQPIATVSPASASASASSQLHGSASRRVGVTHEETDDTDLMDLVRRYLYVPDGEPPANWPEARERSVLKQLVRRHGREDTALAIEGLALLRDQPGVFGDLVDWLQVGSKVTLRALHNTKSGARDMFARAREAFWRKANTDRSPRGSVPEPIGRIMRLAGTAALR